MSTTSKLGELFIDATREVVEKGRIKSQMNRLERIMEADRDRLKTVYAEIGRLYLEGSVAKNKGKIEYAAKEVRHLKLRLDRAEERLEMLKEAHSVDECKEAFRAELSSAIKKAQDGTVVAAYKVKKKAQDVITGRYSQPTINIKSRSTITPDNIAKRAAELSDKKSKKAALANEESIAAILSELDLNEAEDTIDEIIETADAVLNEVMVEMPEISAEATPTDGETAESFDF